MPSERGPVRGPPGLAAVVAAEHARGRYRHEDALRVGGVDDHGVQAHTPGAGLPRRPRTVTSQTGQLMPVRPGVGRPEQGGILHASKDGVRISERRLEVPDPGELPRMRRTVVPLVRARHALVGKVVPYRLPRRAPVIGTLDQLPEPPRGLRRVQPVEVYRGTLDVVDLPTPNIGPLTSHAWRLGSELKTKAPFRVPTRTRTPLIRSPLRTLKLLLSRPLGPQKLIALRSASGLTLWRLLLQAPHVALPGSTVYGQLGRWVGFDGSGTLANPERAANPCGRRYGSQVRLLADWALHTAANNRRRCPSLICGAKTSSRGVPAEAAWPRQPSVTRINPVVCTSTATRCISAYLVIDRPIPGARRERPPASAPLVNVSSSLGGRSSLRPSQPPPGLSLSDGALDQAGGHATSGLLQIVR